MSAAPKRTHGLIFILITVFLDVVGIGIIIPVLPRLLVELTHQPLHEAVKYGGWLIFLYAFMQFVCSPILGNLSDCYGRRPVILLALTAFSIDYLIMGLAPILYVLFIGRIISGITGASFTPANAFVADITPAEKRTQNFGLVGAMWGLGFIFGPVLGGLLGEISLRLPFFCAAGLAAVNALYGYFVLPETLPPERRRPFRLFTANPVGTFVEMKRFSLVFWLLISMIPLQLAHDISPTTWSYYTMHKFAWSPQEVGLSLAAVGLAIAFSMSFLTRILTPKIGVERMVYVGLAGAAVAFLGYAFAPEGWMMYMFIPLGSLMGLAIPALRSIMSNAIPADRQGELQGATTSLIMLVGIFSPVLWTHVFALFSSPKAPLYFPGASYLAGALLLLSCACAIRGVLKRFRNRP